MIHTQGLVGRSKNSPALFLLFLFICSTVITPDFQQFRARRHAWSHDARVARDAEEPGAIVGHSLHARHASECILVCGTGQPPRLATPFNRAHLLQLDLDPDQTRSATTNPRLSRSNTIGNYNSRSNTIGNYNSPITSIDENTHTTRLEHTMV
jgi:hypothetical protein